jgi:hypothetical protein
MLFFKCSVIKDRKILSLFQSLQTFEELGNDLAELEGILGEYHDPMYQIEDRDEPHHEEL